MAASIYNNKLAEPDDISLARDLAASKKLFDTITAFIENEYGDFSVEWKYYNNKSGWILKMFSKKRNVLFVVPCDTFFRVSITLGEKACDTVMNSTMPDSIKRELLDSKKYAEGRTILVDVKSDSDMKDVLCLVSIKLESR